MFKVQEISELDVLQTRQIPGRWHRNVGRVGGGGAWSQIFSPQQFSKFLYIEHFNLYGFVSIHLGSLYQIFYLFYFSCQDFGDNTQPHPL